jgi:hypothetical protein
MDYLLAGLILKFCVIFHFIIAISFPNIDVVLLVTTATKLIWCYCSITHVEVISTWVKFVYKKHLSSIVFLLNFTTVAFPKSTLFFLHVFNVQ